MEDKCILINGAGTVGIRDADVLLSLYIPIILTKYNASEEDIKTKEMFPDWPKALHHPKSSKCQW